VRYPSPLWVMVGGGFDPPASRLIPTDVSCSDKKYKEVRLTTTKNNLHGDNEQLVNRNRYI